VHVERLVASGRAWPALEREDVAAAIAHPEHTDAHCNAGRKWTLMPVRVMHIGNVRVLVLQALMPVAVGMGFARWIVRRMLMLVMLVMDMGVGMLHRIVNMLVLVVLGQVQPHADAHQ
jgi:hypothetical protein